MTTALIGLTVLSCQADTVSNLAAQNSPAPLDYLTHATINDKELILSSEKGQCTLQMGAQTVILDIPFPCGFVRHKDKPAQHFHYPAIGHVLAIAGPQVSEESYTEDDNVSFRHRCSNYGQPIIISNSTIELLKSQQASLSFCHQLGFDEKVFYGFAHFDDYKKER